MMSKKIIGFRLSALFAVICAVLGYPLSSRADYPVEVSGELTGVAGSGDFAPFYMAANKRGKITQSKTILLDLGAFRSMDTTRRFSYSWGVEGIFGAASATDYRRFDPETRTFYPHAERPPYAWLQQLYGEIKYRSLFLSAGLKEEHSMIVDEQLSSGDICLSNNIRPIPAVRAGFIDYQNIPFTKGWVQISGCISFGLFTENKWNHDHFNYYDGKYCDNRLWAYKNIYFRTKPTKPFHVVIGMQNPGLWGGTTYYYSGGKLTKTDRNDRDFKAWFSMLIPHEDASNKEGHYPGDQKGSWDLKAVYRFRDNSELSAYFQWFWEDGSGMAKRNGMDGLWGIQYRRPGRWWINGALFEYFDFTNMCGPLHYALQEHPNSIINVAVGGADNYYNNWYYGAYTNYGMCIGNSLVLGSIYNTDGLLELNGNRVRAYHFAVTGSIGPQVDWTLKFNYRTLWGQTNSLTLIYPKHMTSFWARADWNIAHVPGLSLAAEFGIDHGSLSQNVAAGLLSLTYRTTLFSKQQ